MRAEMPQRSVLWFLYSPLVSCAKAKEAGSNFALPLQNSIPGPPYIVVRSPSLATRSPPSRTLNELMENL